MGIFDFLSDLSSKRGKELDLGGLKSLLGTRKAAEAGARGDEMMKITGNDSLPGYFNPETREYVPWYVDLFDGGGLNQSEGLLNKDAQEIPTAVGLLEANGTPVQRAAQMAPGIGSQLSDMERLNRMPGVDLRNLGGVEGYGPMSVDPYGNWSENEAGMGGGEVISNSQMNQEMYGYDYPTEFPLGAEPEFLQSLERPIRPYAGRDNFMEFSQPSDRAIQRDMPAYPAQVFGVVGTDANMGRQVNPIPQVNAAEFQRFRAKFEDNFKRNGIWGNTEREQAAFQYQKSRGANY